MHDIRLRNGARLRTILGGFVSNGFLNVNSHHHQAVDGSAIPAGWQASAWATDGTVEAIEPTVHGLDAIGVQWHPERLWLISDVGPLQPSATALLSLGWAK